MLYYFLLRTCYMLYCVSVGYAYLVQTVGTIWVLETNKLISNYFIWNVRSTYLKLWICIFLILWTLWLLSCGIDFIIPATETKRCFYFIGSLYKIYLFLCLLSLCIFLIWFNVLYTYHLYRSIHPLHNVLIYSFRIVFHFYTI